MSPSLRVSADIKPLVRALMAFGEHVAPRAITFSVNGVGMEARRRVNRMIRTHIDASMPYTKSAVVLTLASLRPFERRNYAGRAAEVRARITINNEPGKDRIAYFKFLLGFRSVRLPGDVGPGLRHLYIPVWRNLRRFEPALQSTGGANGGLPRTTLNHLIREAGGRRNMKRGARADGGLFIGRPAKALD